MSFAKWVRGSTVEAPLSGSLNSMGLKVGDVVRCTHEHGDCCWVFTHGLSYSVYCVSDDEELGLNGVPSVYWDEVTHDFERVS